MAQAIIQSALFSLSCVRVPVQWCDGYVQRSYAIHRRGKKFRPRSRLALLGLLAMSSIETAYAIPSTGYGLVKGKSRDTARQVRIIENVLNSITSSSSSEPVSSPCTSTSCACEQSNDTPTTEDDQPRVFVADTDSYEFILDTGTNGYIVNDKSLLRNFMPSRGRVKGVNGVPTSYMGTGILELRLKLDCGTEVKVKVKGIYIPNCPYNLLPPQMLVTELKKQGLSAECRYDDETHSIELIDSKTGEKRVLTSMRKPNHLFGTRVNEGYKAFFCHAIESEPNWCCFAGALHTIPPEDESESGNLTDENDNPDSPRPAIPREAESPGQTRETISIDGPHIIEDDSTTESSPIELPQEPQEVEFDQQDVQLQPEHPSVIVLRRKQERLATIHERLGHFSFPKLQMLARVGLIPRDLADIPYPTCPGCAYGKAHRKPFRTKGQRGQLRQATQPGEVVSMDQLISPTAGFVPTHRGTPTTQRYIGATVFVDHYSDFTYVHLMTKLNAETTVEAKRAFERLAQSHGVTIRHYHSDNGLFDTKLFKESVDQSNQTLSFCGPNAHHQNGKAENRIKDITTHARTALLHAAHRWPKAVNAHLWPAALKHYTNVRNSLPTEFVTSQRIGRKRIFESAHGSPLSKFSGTEVEPNLDHFHPFGCPVYVLEGSLQAQQAHNKWSDRSKVGIFLCHSPSHATSVPLVLNTQTGNVAPQFHCIYDDEFSTCKRDAKFASLWQYKAKLASSPVMKSTIERTDQPATLPPSSVSLPDPINAPTTGDLPPSRLTEPEAPTPETVIAEPRTTDFTPSVPTDQTVRQVDPSPIEIAARTDAPPQENLPYPVALPKVTRTGRTVKPRSRLNLLACFFAATSPHVIQPVESVQQIASTRH